MPRKKHTEIEKKIIADISYNLKTILKRKGITQKELAGLSGISSSTISDIVIGNILLSPSNLEKISKALKVEKSLIDSSITTSLKVLDIENLMSYDFIYKGVVLNEEQKKHVLTLLITLLDFPQ